MGNRIKEVRKSKGIKQKELAEMLGVTPQAVSQFEKSDGKNFNYSTLKNIAKALDCTVNDILDVDDVLDEVMEEVYTKIGERSAPRMPRLNYYFPAETTKLNRMGLDALSGYLDLLLNSERYTSEDPDYLRKVWGEKIYDAFYPDESMEDFIFGTNLSSSDTETGNQ